MGWVQRLCFCGSPVATTEETVVSSVGAKQLNGCGPHAEREQASHTSFADGSIALPKLADVGSAVSKSSLETSLLLESVNATADKDSAPKADGNADELSTKSEQASSNRQDVAAPENVKVVLKDHEIANGPESKAAPQQDAPPDKTAMRKAVAKKTLSWYPASIESLLHIDTAVSNLLSLSIHVPPKMKRSHWSLQDFELGKILHKGYAATVYKAVCKLSKIDVVLKVYKMPDLCEVMQHQLYREIFVHSRMHHEHIVQLLASFKEDTTIILVQEYASSGDLFHLVKRNKGFLSERQAVEGVLQPFLLALNYLHTNNIIHRDIKPENLLFMSDGTLKLADFGLAIDICSERANTRAGTLDYMAPEVLNCPSKKHVQDYKDNPKYHYSKGVDSWAVGVLAFELLAGHPPFVGKTQQEVVMKIKLGRLLFPESMSSLARSFVREALTPNPAQRPDVRRLLQHPWIRMYQRFMSVRVRENTEQPAKAPVGNTQGSTVAPVDSKNVSKPKAAAVEELRGAVQPSGPSIPQKAMRQLQRNWTVDKKMLRAALESRDGTDDLPTIPSAPNSKAEGSEEEGGSDRATPGGTSNPRRSVGMCSEADDSLLTSFATAQTNAIVPSRMSNQGVPNPINRRLLRS